GSGLLFQSFRAMRSVDAGFETADLFTFQFAPDNAARGLTDGPTIARFNQDFLERVAALPGVESASFVATLPLDEGANTAPMLAGRAVAPEDAQLLRFTFADPADFETMGIEFLGGRPFARSSEPSEALEVVVSRSAAEALWPGEDPLGQVLRPAVSDTTVIPWMTVAGVVEDVVLFSFRERDPLPLVYAPDVDAAAQSSQVNTRRSW